MPLLIAALDDDAALIRAHAAWALARLALEESEVRSAIVRAMETEEDKQVREDMHLTLIEKD